MKRVLAYVTGQEWAMFVAVVTAALAEAPALAELVQGELNSGEWSYSGLVILVGGFVIRSKVWSQRSVDVAKAPIADLTNLLGEQVAKTVDMKAQLLAAEAVLEAARQGQPLPVKVDPVGGQQPHEGP